MVIIIGILVSDTCMGGVQIFPCSLGPGSKAYIVGDIQAGQPL